MIEPLNSGELSAYLVRIGHSGPLAADLVTLRALHRAHVLAIPFENLDVQLGTPPGRAPDAVFGKLVTRGRGGWCYEQNGLFARALTALGFAVTALSAGVMREVVGDFVMGTHLCLKVTLDGQDWLADVGFGSTLIDPLPFTEHDWDQGILAGTLRDTGDGHLRMAITAGPMPLSYDLVDAPADEALLDAKCAWQGTEPESVFVQNLVVQQRLPDGHLMLRGKVLTETMVGEARERELASAEDLVSVLHERFRLDMPEAANLWDQIEARHAALFAQPA